MAAKLNTAYLGSHRGIIKILQIVFGLIVCTLLCIGSHGFFSGCFYDAASGINAIIVVLNIVFFVLNLVDASQNKWERIYTVVALVLFVLAFVLMLWNLLETHSYYGETKIPATVFLNLVDASQNKWERIYTVVALVLFVLAFVLMLWNLLETHSYYGETKIPATVLIGIQMALFIWDYRILHGQAS
uniref:MARVEL domain-containing protein n=1 Tax=Globodera pallida TaxID=36090 RepID=A0A183BUN5_GLOPA